MSSDALAAARRLEIAAPRFTGWLEGFESRHGKLTAEASDEAVTFTAADGSAAVCQVPFPPLRAAGSAEELAKAIEVHVTADRTVGVFLVRLGGYAAGVFTGAEPVLAASKVGSRLVHGRSAAGGQSQQRFARRRENQAQQALTAAADTAVAVFEPYQLDALVLGGDRRAFAPIRNDARLAPYLKVATEAFLTVPDPKLAVLRETPRMFRAIRILLTERVPESG
jgi:hypothetical protein